MQILRLVDIAIGVLLVVIVPLYDFISEVIDPFLRELALIQISGHLDVLNHLIDVFTRKIFRNMVEDEEVVQDESK